MSDINTTESDKNTTDLCPGDVDNLNEWIKLNKQWAIKEGELIITMITNYNERIKNKNNLYKGVDLQTPYNEILENREIMNVYRNRVINRVNQQLASCSNTLDFTNEKLKNTYLYPRLNLDIFNRSGWNGDNNIINGWTYSTVGGKLHKSKKSKKSKRTKKSKKSKRTKKSRKHR
jgi:hypothetical protein